MVLGLSSKGRILLIKPVLLFCFNEFFEEYSPSPQLRQYRARKNVNYRASICYFQFSNLFDHFGCEFCHLNGIWRDYACLWFLEASMIWSNLKQLDHRILLSRSFIALRWRRNIKTVSKRCIVSSFQTLGAFVCKNGASLKSRFQLISLFNF